MDRSDRTPAPDFRPDDVGSDVVELEVLLPRRDAVDLEEAARRRNLSAGVLLRCAVRDFLRRARPAGEGAGDWP